MTDGARGRLVVSNRLIEVIATCGRRFFNYRDRGQAIGLLEIDKRGRVWFIDGYRGKRIYTQYKGDWYGFSEGGTMQCLVRQLRLFVLHGTTLQSGTLGPWPDWYSNGDPWGYGSDMVRVHKAAYSFGLLHCEEKQHA